MSSPADGDVLRGTSVSITGAAAGSDTVTSVEVSVDGGTVWQPVQSIEGTSTVTWRYSWRLPAEDDSVDHVIVARATDSGGVGYSDPDYLTAPDITVRVDTLAPVVTTFLIDDDASQSADTAVALTIEAVDGSAPAVMQFSNDGVTWSDWMQYAGSVDWELSPGDGTKVVYARVRDVWGNITTATISDSIVLSTVGPAIVGRFPAPGAAGVGTATFVQTLFSGPLDPTTVTEETVQLWLDLGADGGAGDGLLDGSSPPTGYDVQVPGTVTYDPGTYTVTFRPAVALQTGSRYFSRVLVGVRGQTGLPLEAESVSSFTTSASADPLQPGVASITPADGATGIPVTAKVTVVFDREMRLEGFAAGIVLTATTPEGPVVVPADIERDAEDPRVVYLYPLETLDIGTVYTVTVSGALEDYFGSPLGADVTSTFTTASVGVDPHGTFSTGSSVCGICHDVHGAAAPGPFGGPLLTFDRETALCDTCHDGSGASTDVYAEFSAMTSGHVLEDSFVVPGPGLTVRCSSCHDPHEDVIGNPMLPPAAIGEAPVTGNNYTWCEACHDDAASWTAAGYPYPSGSVEATSQPVRDAAGYPVLGTFPGATAYNDTQSNAHNPVTSTEVVWPGSGLLSGDCRNCHLSHGAATTYDSLRAEFRPTPDETAAVGDRADGTYAALCFTCHDADGPSGADPDWPSSSDIKQFVSIDATETGDLYTGGHRVFSAGGTLPVGAPLPCYDCHNPHGSRGSDGTDPNAALLSDELWSGIDTSTPRGVVDFCMQCHLPWEYAQGSGQAEAGSVPAGQATHIEGLDRTIAQNKLSLIPGIVAHGKANTDPANPSPRSCNDCHTSGATAYAAPTGADGYNPHRPDPGRGGCVDCHSQPQGGRRAVVGEFAVGSHHVVGGDVTDADCGVCHMERDAQTGRMDPDYHDDDDLDLRNPDSGDAISRSFVGPLVRNVTTYVLEADITAVQSGLCLACHDANGALSPDARVGGSAGDPRRPFSANTRDAADIYGAMLTSNAFHHAVLGPGNNPYTTPTGINGNIVTMVAPWNQTADVHDVITCFDCHVTTAGHGGVNAFMGRTAFDTAAGQRDLCLTCHKQTVYETFSAGDGGGGGGGAVNTGSRFVSHGRQNHRSTLAGGANAQGCRACHAGLTNLSGSAVPNGSPGNIHGGSFTWPDGSYSPLSSTLHFMYGGYLRGWAAQSGADLTGPPLCWSACHTNDPRTY